MPKFLYDKVCEQIYIYIYIYICRVFCCIVLQQERSVATALNSKGQYSTAQYSSASQATLSLPGWCSMPLCTVPCLGILCELFLNGGQIQYQDIALRLFQYTVPCPRDPQWPQDGPRLGPNVGRLEGEKAKRLPPLALNR